MERAGIGRRAGVEVSFWSCRRSRRIGSCRDTPSVLLGVACSLVPWASYNGRRCSCIVTSDSGDTALSRARGRRPSAPRSVRLSRESPSSGEPVLPEATPVVWRLGTTLQPQFPARWITTRSASISINLPQRSLLRCRTGERSLSEHRFPSGLPTGRVRPRSRALAGTRDLC